MDDSGIVGTVKAQQDYTLNGERKPTQPGYKGYEHVTFLTPTDFDFESYHVANRVFKTEPIAMDARYRSGLPIVGTTKMPP